MTEENPYQAPSTDIGDGEVAVTGPELASPWIRLLAAFIDGLLIMLFILPMQFSMGIYDGFPETMVQPDFITTLTIGLAGIFVYALLNSYTLHRNGQTIGKLICKIKIVRADFAPATLVRIIFIRYMPMAFVTQIPFVGAFIGGLIDPLLIFRKSRQCLHDNIADTVVIKSVIK